MSLSRRTFRAPHAFVATLSTCHEARCALHRDRSGRHSAPEIRKFPRAWTLPAEPGYLSIGIHNAIVLFIASLKKADMTVLSELLEDGRVVPVIDRRYDLDGVPEARQYIEHGHARAKVAVRIS